MFDDYSDDSGSGSALSAIEGLIGIGGTVATGIIAASNGQAVYNPSTGFATGGAAISTAQRPQSSLLLIGILVVVGIYAFKKA